MKKYSLYLFDFDQTTFDTTESLKNIYYKVFKNFGVETKEEEVDGFMKMSLPRAMMSKGIGIENERKFIDYFHEYIKDKEVIELTKVFTDTLPCFNYLIENNIKFGIVTGNSLTHVKDIYDFMGLDMNMFSVFVGNESYTHPKPDAEPILIALQKAGYLDKKEEVVYVGDSEQDQECAINAGIDYVLVDRDNKRQGYINSLMELFK